MKVMEKALLVRDPKIQILNVESWEPGLRLIKPTLRENLDSALDRFINDYLTMNP